MATLTKAQKAALVWLHDRNGDGLFDVHGVAVAAGEIAPVMRSTWNGLKAHGAVEFYNPTGKGRGRLRLTDAGRDMAEKIGGPHP